MKKILTFFLTFLIFIKPVLAQNHASPILPLTIFGLFWLVWIAFFLVFSLISLVGLIFWIIMLIDCVKRDFKKENEKVVWILILVFTNWIGALIYYFVIKRKNKH